MGYPINEPGKTMYAVVEIHYDNSLYHQGASCLTYKLITIRNISETNIADIVDSSGIRFYLTDQLRPVEMGSMTIAMPVSPENMIIPPGQSSFKHYAFCSPRCSKHFPITGINLYSGFLHEHKRGKAVRLRQFRDGVELEPVLEDNHYDFNYQAFRYASRPIVFMPNDTLLLECEYDTTHDQAPVYVSFNLYCVMISES